MHKHTDWRFLLKWLVQTSAAAGFFLISLGAFVLCGWGLLSHLGWLPDLAGVSALQNLAPHIQSCRIYHYVKLAADWFEALCARNYSYCIILLLLSFLILVEAWAALFNRLAAAREIRRYGA